MNYIKAICACIVLTITFNKAMSQPKCGSTPNVSAVGQACPGVTVTNALHAEGTDGTTTYRWYWRGSDGSENALDTFTGSSTPQDITRDGEAGKTYFIMTAGGHCDDAEKPFNQRWRSLPATVGTTSPTPLTSLTTNPVNPNICLGTSITITVTGGAQNTWSWSTGALGVDHVTLTNPPLGKTTVSVVATSTNCPNSPTPSRSIDINVGQPAGKAVLDSGPGEVCGNDNPQYVVHGTNATSFHWYVTPSDWVASGTSLGSSGTNHITWNNDYASNHNGGHAFIHIQSEGTCGTPPDELIYDVTVYHRPVVSAIAATTQNILYNTSVTLPDVTGLLSGETYQWFRLDPDNGQQVPITGNTDGPLISQLDNYYYVGGINTNTGCATLPSDRLVDVVTLYLNPPTAVPIGCSDITAIFGEIPPFTSLYQVSGPAVEGGNQITNPYTFPGTGLSYVKVHADAIPGLWSEALTIDPASQFPAIKDIHGVDFCLGRLGGSITLTNPESATHYQLFKESVPWGPALTPAQLPWTQLSAGGHYSVLATKDGTNCSAKMNGEIIIKKLEPAVFPLTGGGTSCGAGKNIVLTGSEDGVKYQLKIGDTDVGSPMDGHVDINHIPQPITWTGITTPGTYKVVAYSASQPECKMDMRNTVTVQPGPSVAIGIKQYVCTYYLSPVITGLDNCGITAYSWNFDDGTTSIDPAQFHNFPGGRTYNITLNVSSICDGVVTCTASASYSLTPSAYTVQTTDFVAPYWTIEQVINASATTFSDAWILPTEEQGLIDGMNRFISGERGVWRNEGSYAFKASRLQSNPVNIATDGTYTLNTFNWEQANLDIVPDWIKANTVTRYSPYGYELENKDVLDIYSSVVYDYSGQLVTAEGSNARHNEIAYTGFETNLTQGTTGNWTFAASGEKSFELFRVIIGNGHEATIDVPDLSKFPDGSSVEVIAIHLNAGSVFPFTGEGNSISDDLIVCHAMIDGNAKLVLNEAPFDDAWLGIIAIKKSSSGYAATITRQGGPKSHTGVSSLVITDGATTLFPQKQLIVDKDKSYYVSAWISVGNASLLEPIDPTIGLNINMSENGGPGHTTQNMTVNGPVIEGWQQVSGTFSSPFESTAIEIEFLTGNETTIYVDDLRLHPNNGIFKSYVYNLKDYRLSAILDEQNFASFFYYDDEGNLAVTKKETERGIKTISENITHIKTNNGN